MGGQPMEGIREAISLQTYTFLMRSGNPGPANSVARLAGHEMMHLDGACFC